MRLVLCVLLHMVSLMGFSQSIHIRGGISYLKTNPNPDQPNLVVYENAHPEIGMSFSFSYVNAKLPMVETGFHLNQMKGTLSSTYSNKNLYTSTWVKYSYDYVGLNVKHNIVNQKSFKFSYGLNINHIVDGDLFGYHKKSGFMTENRELGEDAFEIVDRLFYGVTIEPINVRLFDLGEKSLWCYFNVTIHPKLMQTYETDIGATGFQIGLQLTNSWKS